MGGGGVRKKWYVVFIGRKPGVYDWWPACHAQVNRFSGALYQSFNSREDAHAAYARWLSNNRSAVAMGGVEKVYVVFEGRQRGVYDSWPDCHLQVNGWSGAVYQAYNGRAAAEAALMRWEAGEGSSSHPRRHASLSKEPHERSQRCDGSGRVTGRDGKQIVGDDDDSEDESSCGDRVGGGIDDEESLKELVVALGVALLSTSFNGDGGKKKRTK